MVVLVNHYSASASEIVSACLQDHKRAVVIGERTWGKGSVQNVIELEGGKSALKLTTASYQRPSGKNIHRFPDAKETDEWGVMPDDGLRGEAQRRPDRATDRLSPRARHPGRQARQGRASVAKPADAPKTRQPDAKPKADQPPKPDDQAGRPKPAERAKPADRQAEPARQSKPTRSAKADEPSSIVQLQKAVDYLTQELARAQ